MSASILISGGAGYIGSHAAYALRQAGYEPVVIDDLSHGNEWATHFGPFALGDIGDADFVQSVCRTHQPLAVLHFAAFTNVEESMRAPAKYLENNRDKAVTFFKTLNGCGVNKIVFSSTAAVYGDAGGSDAITELTPTRPINPYGQSKLEAEAYLRMLDAAGLRSVTLRYFNVAGAAPIDALIGEAHDPETHVLPRLILPLIHTPMDILQALGLHKGFTIYGDDYPTPDGTAVRDYIHVMDLIDAHLRALHYLLNDGETDIFNLGSGHGFSVKEIVGAARLALRRPDFTPPSLPRRRGDPAVLIANPAKASRILGWKPQRSLSDIIADAASWHRMPRYQESMRARIGKNLLRAI